MRGRAAIYIRVSSVGRRDRDSQSYQTEVEQRERCEAYAVARGLDVVAVHSDIDVSGAKWDHAGLDALLKQAERREIDAVIVYRLSRLGRGLRGILDTVHVLQGWSVDPVSVKEGIDLSTSAGRLTFNLLASVDEYERELRGEYWDATKRRARERGVLIGPTPVGFVRNSDSTLAIDPVVGEAVREAYRLRGTGATLIDCGAAIDAAMPTRTGSVRTANQVRRILQNPIYRGILPQDGGTCDAIVTDEEWEAAQTDAIKRPARSGDHAYVLSGIARCGSCGGPLGGNNVRQKDRIVARYACGWRSRPRKERCSMGVSMNADRLEEYVLPVAERVFRASKMTIESAADEGGRLAKLDAAVREAEAELLSYVERTSSLGMQPELWEAGYNSRQQAVYDAQELAAAARPAGDVVGAATWEELVASPMELRQFLSHTIDRLVVSPGKGQTVDRRVDLVIRSAHDAPAY